MTDKKNAPPKKEPKEEAPVKADPVAERKASIQ